MAEIPLGLLGFAAGAMQAGRASPTPLGFGEALGGALQGGLANYGLLSRIQNQNTNDQYRQMALMQGMAQQQEQSRQAAARKAALDQWTQTLPPEQQALAALAPDSYIDARVKSTFETPKPPQSRTRLEGNMEVFEEYDPQRMGFVEVSRAPRFAPDKPGETWRPLTQAEAQQMGAPLDGFYQVSNTGQIRQITGPGSNGVRVEQDANGNPIITVGGRRQPANASPLTNSVTSGVQKDVITLEDQQAQLAEMRNFWKPEYQTLAAQATNAGLNWAEWAGIELSPEQRSFVEDFTTAKASAMNYYTQVLSDLSGAAVTESEAKRASAWMPNVQADGPTEFKSKLDRLYRFNAMSLARKKYLLQKGIEFDFSAGNDGGVRLDQMPDIINRRAAEIESQLTAEGRDEADIPQAVQAVLREEFGI